MRGWGVVLVVGVAVGGALGAVRLLGAPSCDRPWLGRWLGRWLGPGVPGRCMVRAPLLPHE